MIFIKSTHINHTVCRFRRYDMKKLISISVLLTLLATLSSCGEKTGSSENTAKVTTQQQTTAAEEAAVSGNSGDEQETTVRERKIVSNDAYEYEIFGGGAIITKYKGGQTEVTVPDEIDGAPVEEIGFYAFEAQPVTSVTLPESIKVIGEGAFIDCASLVSINLPSALTTVEMGAFAGCSALTELTVPSGVKEIKRGAFASCGSMRSLVIQSMELGYDQWGIEDIPDLTVYAPEGSAAAEWAGAMGKYSVN